MRFCLILITALLLAGCSHHKAPPPNARLSDSITVIAGLNDQLQSWHGTPYRYGGMTRRGVDCSGFVVVTMRDSICSCPVKPNNKPLLARKLIKTSCCQVTWSFSKRGPDKMVCM